MSLVDSVWYHQGVVAEAQRPRTGRQIWPAQAREPLPDAALYVGFGAVCGEGAAVGGKDVHAAARQDGTCRRAVSGEAVLAVSAVRRVLPIDLGALQTDSRHDQPSVMLQYAVATERGVVVAADAAAADPANDITQTPTTVRTPVSTAFQRRAPTRCALGRLPATRAR